MIRLPLIPRDFERPILRNQRRVVCKVLQRHSNHSKSQSLGVVPGGELGTAGLRFEDMTLLIVAGGTGEKTRCLYRYCYTVVK